MCNLWQRPAVIASFLAFVVAAWPMPAAEPVTSENSATPAAEKGSESEKKEAENPLATPKGSLLWQLKLVQAGKVAELKKCFTPRLREKITPLVVQLAAGEAKHTTPELLVDRIEMGEFEGRKTAKVFAKNGRAVTTLIETEGVWLADTLWFL